MSGFYFLSCIMQTKDQAIFMGGLQKLSINFSKSVKKGIIRFSRE
jgi:hypothetical protein